MTKSVDFIFDFGSPNVYMAYKVLPEIVEQTGAEINIVPCLLGGIFKATGNQAPFAAFGHIKNKIPYEMLEIQRFIKKHNLPFRMNPSFPINTVSLMRGLIVAQKLGVEGKYIDAILKAMWEDEKNTGDLEVVTSVLTDAGLDAAAILAGVQEDAVKAELRDNTEKAVERGAFGAPTFFIGDEMFFGKDRLAQVEEALG